MEPKQDMPGAVVVPATGIAEDELAQGHRVLHVVVPAHAFNHAKAQAALSGLSFKAWIRRALEDAFPYNDSDRSKKG
jgi:hypothetical protein